jgi:RimJ/RimL family protein N-acetyltransferase
MPGAGRVRVLGPGDETAVRAFFERHPDTTLFFQNNVATAGLVDRGVPYSGTYVAAFDGDAVAAMAAHYWQGNLILEAPRGVDEVARAAIAASGRPVSGLLGPWAQVQAARAALGLGAAVTTMDSPDELFAVSLAALRVPTLLARADVRCRHPRADELEQVVAWREDYAAAVLGQERGPALTERSRGEILRNQAEGRNFVLEVDGALVAYSGYNAMTSSCVQVGGVWTPPRLRGRGYARAVVAGSLLSARTRGVARSILFTGVENVAAQAAYAALGYERVGDYGLVLFAEPQPVG